MKYLITITLLLLSQALLFGQAKLNSKVISEDSSPLFGASVVIMNASDSTLIKGSITNEKGEFTFKDIK